MTAEPTGNATLAAAGADRCPVCRGFARPTARRIDTVDPGYGKTVYVDWHYADQQINPRHQRGFALDCLDCEAVNPHRTRKATR